MVMFIFFFFFFQAEDGIRYLTVTGVQTCALPISPAKRIEDGRIGGERLEADRAEMHREIARGNGAGIIADPSLGLEAITIQQSTFTRRDMAKFAHRHSDGVDQFN